MKTHLNLLPLAYRRKCLLWRRLRQWGSAWALGLLIAAAMWMLRWGQVEAEADLMLRTERRYAPVAALESELGQLQTQIQELQSRETMLASLKTRRPALSLLGLVSQSARRCNGDVALEELMISQKSKLGAKPGGKADQPAPAGMLTLKGLGVDNLAVAKFVVALRESRCFSRVELKSSAKQATADRIVSTYVVECEF